MSSADRYPAKVCVACGRTMAWRAKWARNWDAVRYCSDACRRRKLSAVDAEIESVMLTMLDQRPREATMCPSEVARAVGGENWRSLMEPVRSAARRLAAAGEVEVTQRSRVVNPSTAKGPIRLRRQRPGQSS